MKTTLTMAAISAVKAYDMSYGAQLKFMNFVAAHSKNYSTNEEFALRFEKWAEIDEYIL